MMAAVQRWGSSVSQPQNTFGSGKNRPIEHERNQRKKSEAKLTVATSLNSR